jgi:hypothetical protein
MRNLNPVLEPPTLNKTDPDVARYEHMPIELVRRELQKHNIDPAPTIAEVTRLVEAALAARPDPKKRP